MNTTHSDWLETAWNGIRFRRPPHWEITRIGNQDLLLADEEGPVLEIKWGPASGTFSHDALLKRLALKHRLHGPPGFSAIPVPEEWVQGLRRFRLSGFEWRDGTTGGRGVIFDCPRCSKAGLIQFIHRPNRNHFPDISSNGISTTLLASFRDHSEDGRNLFALYDIRLVVPEAFRLHSYRFTAGAFELHFRHRRISLTFYRWGLAGLRLAGNDLALFGRKIFAVTNPVTQENRSATEESVEWRLAAPPWWSRLISKAPFQQCRLRYIESRDRILGVRITGKQPINDGIFRQLTQDFTLVP
ncbi:MAG: hypothetical protein ACOZF0_13700 [Thermodesulfobacteriota bacterium]